MIKAQVLLSWEDTVEGKEPVLNLRRESSVMDRTGQPNENIIPDPNLVLWELWTEDLTLYELDTDIHIISSVTIDDEGEITENQPTKIDDNEAERLRLFFVREGLSKKQITSLVETQIIDRDYSSLIGSLKTQLKRLDKQVLAERI